MSWFVAQATDEVIDRLTELEATSLAEGINIVRRLRSEWAGGIERFDRPGEQLLIATDGNGPIGIGGLTLCPTVADALRVRRFYIHPSARRGGIARHLASTLLEHAAGHTRLVTCHAGASDAAAPFWESLGFTRTDEHPGITHDIRV